MKNKKGFTLIELLAVIVILGLLIVIAIPSITKYINQSKKKTLATTISKYVEAGMLGVNNGEYAFTENNVIYAIPIECIPMERGGDNPFGEWNQVNNKYWAYVLVQYDPETFSYKYGFTFRDSAGFGMHPVSLEDMDSKGSNILTNLELSQPRTGLSSNFLDEKYWEKSGFKVDSQTRVKVIQSRLEGDTGDGENTCTLHNKGLNYEEIEEIRTRSGTLINSGSNGNLVFGQTLERSKIEEIHTVDYVDVPTDAIDSWDASIQKNESIKAWLTDKDNDGLYELYLAQEGGVIAPSNSSGLFYGYSKVITIELENFDTLNVTNMSEMFSGCRSLTNLDLNYFNTSKVIDMGANPGYGDGMFANCTSLTNLDLSNWDVSNVKIMGMMFYNCKNLKSLNLDGWDVSNVTIMWQMFNGCSSLTSLDLSSFKTTKATNMNSMFSGCSSLTSLNISNFDTSNVIYMNYMFNNCKRLNTLDVSRFNTAKVITMNSMFYGCSALKEINLDSFNTSNVTDMSAMFRGCSSLTNLDLNHFNTSKVTDMGALHGYYDGMFENCTNLTSLDLSNWDVSNVKIMGSMFNGCKNLVNLNLNGWDVSNVTIMWRMFNGCSSLTSLDLSSFKPTNATDLDGMFSGCSKMLNLDIRQFDFSKITSYGNMLLNVPTTSKVIVKDDETRNWIQTKFNNYTNIVTVAELQ